MAVLPRWLLGKHITAVTIVPQSVNASDGAMTAGTAQSIKGRVDQVRLVNRVMKENIMPVDGSLANNVVIADDMEIELTEILVNGSAGSGANRPPTLPQLAFTADVFAITFGRGQQTYGPIYVSRGDLTDGVTAQGKNTVSMSFSLVDAKTGTTDGAPSVGIPYGASA